MDVSSAATFYKCMDPWQEGDVVADFPSCIGWCSFYKYAAAYVDSNNATSVTCVCGDDPDSEGYTDLSGYSFSCDRHCPNELEASCGSVEYPYAFSVYEVNVGSAAMASNTASVAVKRILPTTTSGMIGLISGVVIVVAAIVCAAVFLAYRFGIIQVKKPDFKRLLSQNFYQKAQEDEEEHENLVNEYVGANTTVGRRSANPKAAGAKNVTFAEKEDGFDEAELESGRKYV
ncbi:hypothetical protein HDU83_008970 [Entophlyctis luteolus]|nr:hypothetical protein HDU82_006730 [Entophlyctis luteolus]KAJ3351347.1 hypothetical protein HDU83_008970 [Entophlyctis luteolus]